MWVFAVGRVEKDARIFEAGARVAFEREHAHPSSKCNSWPYVNVLFEYREGEVQNEMQCIPLCS